MTPACLLGRRNADSADRAGGAGIERAGWAAPPGGSTAPMTIAGHVAQGLAECFCGLVIHQLKAKGATVLLAGMKSPRNWGEDYVASFEAIYPSLAQKHAVPLYPFFLEGIATR